jgi:RimJ/RimL family protein N-acetyltransferase
VSDESFALAVPEIPRTEEGVQEYLGRQVSVVEPAEGECFDLLAELRDSEIVVGLVTLVLRPDREGGIGYALRSEHRGRGYATEASQALLDWAFQELGLVRIWADTTESNVASWAVMERLGMRRQDSIAGGAKGMRPDNGVRYAILVDDWRRSREAGDERASDG